jgi:exopolysaccharide biosynthesis polyprenyl glycosylphosphotransferase
MCKFVFRLTLTGFYIFLDCVCIFFSVLSAYGAYHFFNLGREVTYEFSTLISFSLALAVVGCAILFIFGAYRRESGILNVLEVKNVILGVLTCFAITNTFFFAIQFAASRYIMLFSFLFMLFLVPLARSIAYTVLVTRLPKVFQRRILIYGAGKLGQRLYREIHNSPRLLIKVCGFIDDDLEKRGRQFSPCGFKTDYECRVLGNQDDLPHLIRTLDIQEIYVAVSNIASNRLNQLLEICRQLNLDVAFIPCLHEIFSYRVRLENVGNLPLVREQGILSPSPYERAKRFIDLGLGVVLCILALPLMTIISLAIKLDSAGPILFKQKRVGRYGRLFELYKFRSMFPDAPQYAINPDSLYDPRITRVGRFLRRSSLDELPQLVNVLKGEMSLVGPRPEMPFIVEQYDAEHKERLKALPGITGLWQLSGDRRKAIHENMEYDLYYLYNQSFFLDVTILFQTLVFAFKGL